MTESYRVRVAKESLVFSAAHLITIAANVSERLHRHNNQIAVPLDDNRFVIDFISLRDATKAVCDELEHLVLLPTLHRQIHVKAEHNSVEARFEDRRWVFPREDCVLLPLANTTAELLA